MAIPKKGSRRIVVDARAYGWLIWSRPAYAQALAESTLSFAVDCEEGGRSTLLVSTNMARPDNWLGVQAAGVTPWGVARAVRQALKQGWNPLQCAGAFELAIRLPAAAPLASD
jgi:N-acetylmuramic acid 6-phosphate (MurNAc-6-P) etherase